MRHDKVLEQVVHHLRHPQPPLPNGAQMLCVAPRDEDLYFILALNPKDGLRDEYVVWTMDSLAACSGGHYFIRIYDAIEYFVTLTEGHVSTEGS